MSEIPIGLCQCGCGKQTRTAPQTRVARGWVRGRPLQYIGAHRPHKTFAERFWPKVNKNGPVPLNRPELGPCWLWTGFVNKTTGYGQFQSGIGAHRVGYELVKGPIPDGYEPDHLCLVRNCVNADHLEAVTRRENLIRSSSFVKDNIGKTHCPVGHPLSGDNLMASKLRRGRRACRMCGNAKNMLRMRAYSEQRRAKELILASS